MRALITTLGLAATALTVTTPAFAQQFCADRSIVTDRLQANYGESFAGGGVRNEKSIFEVWMSEEKGTWTILMTMADGRTCVMASGTDWRVAMPSDMTPPGIPG